MAVLSMKKINICAMKKDRKAVLEELQSLGAVEIQTDGVEDDVFKKMNTATQRGKYEKRVANADRALEILQQYAPESTSMLDSLKGRREVKNINYVQLVEDRRRYNGIVKNIIDKDKEISNLNSAISKSELSIESLRPWTDMDIPINTSGTKHTDVILGSMAPGLTEDMIREMISSRQPDIQGYDVKVISTDKDQTCIFVIALKNISGKVEEALRSEGFTRMSFFSKRTPKDKIEKYRREISEYKQNIQSLSDEISSYADNRDDIKLLSDYYRIRADKYQVLGELLQSKSTFVITGYILEQDSAKVEKILNERFSLMVEITDVLQEETAPVKLHNKKVFASAEGVLNSFGLPGRGEMDPTAPMSLFYIFLFGLMLSDAAYGLIIFLACAIILKKFPKMDEALAKSIRLFMYCGISTLVWGVLFGGYFGDLITVVSRVFFHHEVTIKPLWFAPLDDPMRLLVFSLLFGLIHLFGGLALKGYMCLKKKDFVGFFADVIPWFLLIGSLVLMLMPTELFASIAQTSFNFPGWLKTTSYAMAIVGAAVIVVMSGRSHKNPALRLALGLYDIYNLTGWLSDLLSYSRLLALGLATGVIAQVVNQMGSMVGDSVFGVIVFILVFIIGHTFNLAINMLGAYVHTCRLQYVEFFGKFYEGGGIAFNPFREKTKYVDIVDQK